MKNILFFCLLITFFSCSKKELNLEKNLEKYDFDNLYEVNYEDTLYIKSKFSECGEWGGHDEVIKVFLVKERKTMLRFERNEVIDCDIRNSTYGNHQYDIDLYNNLLKSLKIPEVRINEN